MKQLDESSVVWIVRVSESMNALLALEPLLNADERERAARFRFPEDRARFTLGRALARKALGHFLARDPASIELTLTERGRPVLPQEELAFNITHAGDLVAVAVAKNARVGIDIERVERKVDLMGVGEKILSEEDFARFCALADEEKAAAFFRIWTRKEAYLKATGAGITDGLKEISVSFEAEMVGPITDVRDEAGARKWRLHALPVPGDYQGCMACDEPTRGVVVEWARLTT
jgi:4'-phosphopantetheinyl transferase